MQEGLKRRHQKVGKVLKIIRGKDDVIRRAVVGIFNEKMEKKPSATTSEIVSIGNITREMMMNHQYTQMIYTNDVEKEESKSLINLDSAEGDLGGSDAGGRTKI